MSKGFKFFEKEGAKLGGCTKRIIAELFETGDHEVGSDVVEEDIPLQGGATFAASRGSDFELFD